MNLQDDIYYFYYRKGYDANLGSKCPYKDTDIVYAWDQGYHDRLMDEMAYDDWPMGA
jgi:hypothetical protein